MKIISLIKKAKSSIGTAVKAAATAASTAVRKTADRAKSIKSIKAVSFMKHHKIMLTVISAITVMTMLMSVVLLRRNEVRIFVDGKEAAAFTTLKGTADEWLDISGIKLYNGDSLTADGTDLYIDRAFYVTVNADGRSVTLRTGKTTAASVLETAGISVGENDIVSIPAETELTAAASVTVQRVSSDTAVETEIIEYETEKVNTDKLYVGETEVKTKGQNGEIRHTYALTLVDGVETERTLISSETVTEAVNKVVLVGTKEKPVVKASSSAPSQYKEVITMRATAYTYGEDGGNRTSTGIRPYRGIVAVDPRVIPLGTKLYIESSDGRYVYGEAVAADTGGSIKGNKIDVFLESESECYSFGRRTVNVYILD